MIPVTTFRRKQVAVFGLGGSGLVTAKALTLGGANVVAWDDNEAARAKAAEAGVQVGDLREANWRKMSALVLAPGVPLTHPEPHWTVKAAEASRVPVIGDVELFMRERARLCPAGPMIAITGTNGKSTTTALIAHLLYQDGRDVQLGGNIGTPILALEPFHLARFYIIELSSFQIDLTPSLKPGSGPTVGVLLNVTPDHLDRHGTLERYAAIKQRLVNAAEQTVVCVDDDITRRIADEIEGRTGFVYRCSATENFAQGYHATAGKLRFDSPAHNMAEELADLSGVRSLRGRHNTQNAAAAVAALGALGAGLSQAAVHPLQKTEFSLQRRMFESVEDFLSRTRADPRQPLSADIAVRRRQALQDALNTFAGLPHRMQEIGRLGRISFVNDSKATNADSTDKALATFPRDIFWIAGGKQKEGGIVSLAPFFGRIAKAYLIGECADAFAGTLDGKVAFERSGTLDAAVQAAVRDASACNGAEPVVLLSPACASYDQFPNFEVRGEVFRKLVAGLPGIEMTGGDR